MSTSGQTNSRGCRMLSKLLRWLDLYGKGHIQNSRSYKYMRSHKTQFKVYDALARLKIVKANLAN